jgi:hypothetical protein
LPWLPGIPDRIAADRDWGPYLDARSQLVAQLADQVRLNTAGVTPAWAAQAHPLVPAELIADIQVWRAATQVDPSDLRPTGPAQLGYATRIFQQQLDMQLADINADGDGGDCSPQRSPRHDGPIPAGAEQRLTNLTAAGFDATCSCGRPPAAGPLPDDHPAAALWWRILDQLPQTPNQEPATRGSPTTRRHDHDLTRQAAHRCRARRRLPRSAEPLKRPPITTPGEVLRRTSCRTLRLIKGGSARW